MRNLVISNDNDNASSNDHLVKLDQLKFKDRQAFGKWSDSRIKYL
jgi:hypothetical protein